MMTWRVLTTGGAGFIGSHLADELLAHGHAVRVLDSLIPQVHGADRRRPSYLAPEVELVEADVRDHDAVRRALRGVDAVYHLAARIGVGQSMYEVAEYCSINTYWTSMLHEALIDRQMTALEPFDVTLTFCFTPEASGIEPHHTSPPRHPEEFAGFCAEMVRRYAR